MTKRRFTRTRRALRAAALSSALPKEVLQESELSNLQTSTDIGVADGGRRPSKRVLAFASKWPGARKGSKFQDIVDAVAK